MRLKEDFILEPLYTFNMALAAKTARLALGKSVIDAQFLADRVLFMNSKFTDVFTEYEAAGRLSEFSEISPNTLIDGLFRHFTCQCHAVSF